MLKFFNSVSLPISVGKVAFKVFIAAKIKNDMNKCKSGIATMDFIVPFYAYLHKSNEYTLVN
jgi:hypothetical protein